MTHPLNLITRSSYDIIIGIDPDSEKSGVAWLCPKTRVLTAESMPFPKLLDFLATAKADSDEGTRILVVIEAGWLNRSNWHIRKNSTAYAAEIGRATGRNHQTGILIAEMCEHMQLPYELRKPLRKCWKGKDGKITHAELKSFTGIEGRTNQDERDACLLCWIEAELPIRVAVDR